MQIPRVSPHGELGVGTNTFTSLFVRVHAFPAELWHRNSEVHLISPKIHRNTSCVKEDSFFWGRVELSPTSQSFHTPTPPIVQPTFLTWLPHGKALKCGVVRSLFMHFIKNYGIFTAEFQGQTRNRASTNTR